MATKPAAATPTYHELAIQGPRDLVHGFLAGLAAGAGSAAVAVFANEAGVAGPGLAAKLKGMIGAQHQACRVILDGELRGLLKGATKRMTAETGLVVLSDSRIRRASFGYRFQAYAVRYGVEIQDLLASLPAGLKIADRRVAEKHDPRARGVEAYAPAHDYEIEGGGTIVGRFDLVAEARRRLSAHPLIDADEIELDLG
ncbi:MAG: hypothetical protein Q7W56_13325 [Candidatus Latescibacteria bacterium]|nr:hypothetical protein [Candidatus Latescibacterota bacterium]